MSIAEKIRFFRKSAGLSQEMLAERLSVSVGTISNYETGKRMPDITTLKKIAAALEISLSDLHESRMQFAEYCYTSTSAGDPDDPEDQYAAQYRESEMIRSFRLLAKDEQDIILGEIKKLLKKPVSQIMNP